MPKDDIRRAIRARFKQQQGDKCREWSSAVCQRLLHLPRILDAQTILAFMPMKDEVDILPAIEKLYEMGKDIVLPVVVNDTDMMLKKFEGTASLTEGRYGIKEPAGQPFTRHSEIDVAIVPGMAFDDNGNRLGRGKGYYDRFLCRLPNIYKIGVCFPFQLIDTVPTTPTDIVMNEIVCQ